MNGLHFDTKNIFYAYLIVEILLKNYKFYYFYNFDDITAANHVQTNDALINHKSGATHIEYQACG